MLKIVIFKCNGISRFDSKGIILVKKQTSNFCEKISSFSPLKIIDKFKTLNFIVMKRFKIEQ